VTDHAARPSPRPRILAIANQKGGVGKTTTAINLSTALAAVGEKVLLIDLDPQGNASTGLGSEAADRAVTTYDALMGEYRLEAAVVESGIPGLRLAPAGVDLAGAEVELIDAPRRHYRLADALDDYLSGAPETTYVLIDCPPSLSLLTINALAAADAVIIPLQAEFFALEGLSQIMRTIETVRGRINPRLELQGIVLTMVDLRNNLAGAVEEDVLVGVSLEADVSGQRAELGVALGVKREVTTGTSAVAPVVATRAGRVFFEVNLETDVAADLQAGFGARNVEVTRAECVANANVFHRLRLGGNDSVGGLSAGDCCESSSGADEKALDVHFLTSSQKVSNGSGFFAEGQRSLPHPQVQEADDQPPLLPKVKIQDALP